MHARTWAERVESIPMTRGNWPEGGEGHLLPEGTGKGQAVVLGCKLEAWEKQRCPVEMMRVVPDNRSESGNQVV